jgi:hypothetical protein
MKKNYNVPVQKKGRGRMTNYKKTAHELHELTRISKKKETDITTTKGSHGLHQDTMKLQSMTALIKSFCGGVQGGQFFQKAPPLATGGKK